MSGPWRRLGESWPGAGPHEGHTVTAIEAWPLRMHWLEGHYCSGRVRCTCGEEWDTSVWPRGRTHLRVAENTALCTQAGETTQVDVWGEYLTDIPDVISCEICVEWMHA